MKPKVNNARSWFVAHGYTEVAGMIDEIEAEWKAEGKRTRRNWWEAAAGDRHGRPRIVAGRVFPIIAAARARQNLKPAPTAIANKRRERSLPLLPQNRWAHRGQQTLQ